MENVPTGCSRRKEAHLSSGNPVRSEPPHVGCYIFNGLSGGAGYTAISWIARLNGLCQSSLQQKSTIDAQVYNNIADNSADQF